MFVTATSLPLMSTAPTPTCLCLAVGELLQKVRGSIAGLEHRGRSVAEACVVAHDLTGALGRTDGRKASSLGYVASRATPLGEVTRATREIRVHLAELIVQREAVSTRAGCASALETHTTAGAALLLATAATLAGLPSTTAQL